MGRMTKKQILFCEEYVIDWNATQAAIRAGYSERSAQSIAADLLKKPEIQAFIQQRMKDKQDSLIADQDEVLRYFTSVMRGETLSEVVVVESKGDFTSEARRIKKAPAENERLDAAKQLGRRYGLFTDKVEEKVDTSLNITIDYGDEQ